VGPARGARAHPVRARSRRRRGDFADAAGLARRAAAAPQGDGDYRPPRAFGPWPDGLLDFKVAATLDGEALSEEEISALLAGTDGLALLRGQWVEVDRARLEQAMTQFSGAESLAAREGVSFDLRIGPREVRAKVIGSEIYSILITIKPLPAAAWTSICADCAGRVDSLVELL